MQTSIIKTTIVAAAIALVGGCATITPEEFEAVKSQAASAASSADQALNTANNALAVANEANVTAVDAKNAADAAMACCQDNASKIDRAFTKAMAK